MNSGWERYRWKKFRIHIQVCINCTWYSFWFLVFQRLFCLTLKPCSQRQRSTSRLCCWFMYKNSGIVRWECTSRKLSNNCVFSERSGPAFSHQQLFPFKDCKWKMYIELDGDEIAITYIKDVVFNANRADVEALRMTKVLELHVFGFRADRSDSWWAYVFALQPPFVMDKWITGIQPNQRVDYTVTYEVHRISHWPLEFAHM